MGTRGVVIIDLAGNDDEMNESKETRQERHTCTCEVCHCDTDAPKGYEGRAIKYDQSLILLPHAYAELWSKWSAGQKLS